ncbi:ParB family chromosome partitioning protein [Mesorhizobium sp. J18]|nr:ParB family chromosome partitioning protein [Mesorhizobium sp. J18]
MIGEIDKAPPSANMPVSADRRVPIELVSPNPRNPRRNFAEEDLADLAQSVREHGIVQPVIVRPAPKPGHYEIIAGERRWRAAQRAGLTELPVIIREVDDRAALELAIIENVQRADLNPVEEANGYQLLMDEHNYTQADLAQVIGKSRSHVANTLRLLKLPRLVHELIENGSLTAGHARTLVNAEDPMGLAAQIMEKGLSVRQAEALASQPARQSRQARPKPEKDADTQALEKLLGDTLGLNVTINHKEKGGEVRIAYQTLEQLDELCRRLKS